VGRSASTPTSRRCRDRAGGDLGPGGSEYPVRRLTRDAGTAPALVAGRRAASTGRWGRSSSSATSRHLRLRGADTSVRERAGGRGPHIGFRAPTDRPAGTLALVGATVITMRGDEVIPTRPWSSRGTASPPSARAQVQVPAGAHGAWTSPAGPSCRASSTCTRTARRQQRHHARRPLGLPGEPRLRRDHDARPVEQHGDGLQRVGADQGRALIVGRGSSRPARSCTAPRAARRRSRHRTRMRSAPAADEGGRRVQREELQPAAARRSGSRSSRPRASWRCWWCPRAAAPSSST
jgi:hypothetical protein